MGKKVNLKTLTRRLPAVVLILLLQLAGCSLNTSAGANIYSAPVGAATHDEAWDKTSGIALRLSETTGANWSIRYAPITQVCEKGTSEVFFGVQAALSEPVKDTLQAISAQLESEGFVLTNHWESGDESEQNYTVERIFQSETFEVVTLMVGKIGGTFVKVSSACVSAAVDYSWEPGSNELFAFKTSH